MPIPGFGRSHSLPGHTTSPLSSLHWVATVSAVCCSGLHLQMGKFIPNLAEKTKPLREPLQKDAAWILDSAQQSSFEELKNLLASSPILLFYDPSFQTILSADTSSFGLGAVLLQRQPPGDLKPVAYVPRSMTPTEQRYAQKEKEALPFPWACERLSTYLIGLRFHIETDHKPLVPLFRAFMSCPSECRAT